MFVLTISFIILIIMSVPIAFALGISSFLYFFIYHPDLILIIPQKMYAGLNNQALISLPLFILMGQLMDNTGLTTNIIKFCNLFLGKLKGGLGCINIFASMIFGGISGSSASDTASIGAVLIPEMEKKGYKKEFAAGVTVASSTMGMIIPPSVPMVLFAILSLESVGALFLGSIIPGILIGLFQLIIMLVLGYKRDYPREQFEYSKTYVWNTLKESIFAIVMPIFVVGSIVLGIATTSESASFGVFYAIIIGLWVYKGLKIHTLLKMSLTAVKICAAIVIIISMSQLYVWILALERIPYRLAEYMLTLQLPAPVVLTMIMILILLAGTFIDVSPAIYLFTPVFLPVAKAFGISGIQFGVLLITSLAVGAVTPPVGTCLNVAAAISKLSINKIFIGALPFLLGNFGSLLLICFVPQITLYLPALLY